MNETCARHRRAFLDQHRVGQAAPCHLVDSDLQHLGPARQTHLDSDSAFTAAEATIDRQLLHQIGICHAQVGVGMRELGRCARMKRRAVQNFRVTFNLVHCHRLCCPRGNEIERNIDNHVFLPANHAPFTQFDQNFAGVEAVLFGRLFRVTKKA